MKREVFKEIVETCNNMSNCVDKLYELKIDIINSPFFTYFNTLESICIKNEYGDEGYDWYMWFIYEKMTSKNPEKMRAWDENGNEILKDLDELYDYLEKNYNKNLDNIEK